jgi:hypothetical protein
MPSPSLTGQKSKRASALIATSKRHIGIQKLARAALLLSGSFGIFTILLAAVNNKYEDDFSKYNNYSAYKISILLDKSNFENELGQANTKCTLNQRHHCGKLLSLLVSILNRANDYKTLMIDTFNYDESSFPVKGYNKIVHETDSLMQNFYGLSFSKAKALNLLTPEKYISHVSTKQFRSFMVKNPSSRNSPVDIKKSVANKINLMGSPMLSKSSFPNGNQLAFNYKLLKVSFFAVITLELMVFILVSIMGIQNYKAEWPQENIIHISRFSSKFRLVLFSTLFSFIAIICAQYLLGRELNAMKYKYCREFNQYSVIFSGQIPANNSFSVLFKFKKLTAIPTFCVENFSIREQQSISNLYQMSAQKKAPDLEIYKAVITEQADALNRLENQASENTKKILYTMLSLNVMVLVCTAAILRHESLEIEQNTD